MPIPESKKMYAYFSYKQRSLLGQSYIITTQNRQQMEVTELSRKPLVTTPFFSDRTFIGLVSFLYDTVIVQDIAQQDTPYF